MINIIETNKRKETYSKLLSIYFKNISLNREEIESNLDKLLVNFLLYFNDSRKQLQNAIL